MYDISGTLNNFNAFQDRTDAAHIRSHCGWITERACWAQTQDPEKSHGHGLQLQYRVLFFLYCNLENTIMRRYMSVRHKSVHR